MDNWYMAENSFNLPEKGKVSLLVLIYSKDCDIISYSKVIMHYYAIFFKNCRINFI